ncbi:MAG TPA: Ku protein [Jiangellaceae bacterium]|nr:Ku protein [Jiangellaceae bacterium]
MVRPVWQGSITFGLVNVGVGLYSATEEKTVAFHQFEKGTGKRVRNMRVAEGTDREVDYADVAKGYETESGDHVIVTQEELESVAPETSRSITIEDFVELADIDPIYFERTYYLAPRDEANEHAYALLREAMNRAGLAGIAALVVRNKQYLAAIRARDDVLVLNTMHFADEVRDPADTVGSLPAEGELPKRELDMAVGLISELTVEWDPARYHDTHRERVLKLIEQKASGEEPEIVEAEESQENVVDLVAALQESIERARAGGGTRRKGRAKRPAPKRRKAAKLTDLSKKELYDRASELDISGRSTMSRDQLEDAIAKAS